MRSLLEDFVRLIQELGAGVDNVFSVVLATFVDELEPRSDIVRRQAGATQLPRARRCLSSPTSLPTSSGT